MPSAIFDPTRWTAVPGFAFTDITYHRAVGQGTDGACWVKRSNTGSSWVVRRGAGRV